LGDVRPRSNRAVAANSPRWNAGHTSLPPHADLARESRKSLRHVRPAVSRGSRTSPAHPSDRGAGRGSGSGSLLKRKSLSSAPVSQKVAAVTPWIRPRAASHRQVEKTRGRSTRRSAARTCLMPLEEALDRLLSLRGVGLADREHPARPSSSPQHAGNHHHALAGAACRKVVARSDAPAFWNATSATSASGRSAGSSKQPADARDNIRDGLDIEGRGRASSVDGIRGQGRNCSGRWASHNYGP